MRRSYLDLPLNIFPQGIAENYHSNKKKTYQWYYSFKIQINNKVYVLDGK